MFQTSRRAVLTGAGALAATAAAAQTPDKPAAPAPLPRVALKTAAGLIVIELAADRAPVTSANFLRYVDAKRFDGATFYRAMKLSPAPPLGVIQGGANNDPAGSFRPSPTRARRRPA